MNFLGRNHPKSQKCSCRDDFPSENSSLHGKIPVQRCFCGWKIIPAKQKANFKMIQRPEQAAQPEQPTRPAQPTARTTNAARTTNDQNSQRNQNSQRSQ